ncbi:MAG: MipA/OmpV family protein, partial [Brevundimonas sp.]
MKPTLIALAAVAVLTAAPALAQDVGGGTPPPP